MNPMMKTRAVVTGVELEKNKNEYTLQKLAELTEVKIAEIDADVELYTDGSTSGEQQNEGQVICARQTRKCPTRSMESSGHVVLFI